MQIQHIANINEIEKVNNMEKILSISIAAYNVEKYIKMTLNSFIIPEILDDLEVILVNDGSKDYTSQLSHEIEQRYPFAFTVIDKKNGGYGSTINTSIQMAHGKYFKTIDGDDWVEQEGLIKLIHYLKNTDDDMIITNYTRVNDKTGKKVPTIFECKESKKSFYFVDLYKNQKFYMQGITFKTSILKNMHYMITEHCFYTDIEYILTPIPFINTISFLDENVYMYRIAVNEQSMSVAGKRKHIDEQLKILKKMIQYYNVWFDKLDKGKQSYFNTILSGMLKSHITAILSLKITFKSKKRLLDIEKYVKYHANTVYETSDQYKIIRLLRKTKYMIYPVGSILYRLYQKILCWKDK